VMMMMISECWLGQCGLSDHNICDDDDDK